MKRLLTIFIIIIFLLFIAGESSARTEVSFYISFGIVIGGLTIFLSIGGDVPDFSKNEMVGLIAEAPELSGTGFRILSW